MTVHSEYLPTLPLPWREGNKIQTDRSQPQAGAADCVVASCKSSQCHFRAMKLRVLVQVFMSWLPEETAEQKVSTLGATRVVPQAAVLMAYESQSLLEVLAWFVFCGYHI